MAAALTFPLPEAKAEAEQSQEIGVKIDSTIKVERKTWGDIVSEQLKRREEQEKARQAQIEAARKAEEAEKAKQAEEARKTRQRPLKIAQVVHRAVSYANTYTPGYCTYFVASRRAVPSGWGNARNWLANARAAGWATGSTPRVGAIAWTGVGAMGHVAYTERVEGNRALISEMNYNGLGVVSQRWVSFSEFTWIY